MRDWGYRARFLWRDAVTWVGDHARAAGMLALLLLVVLTYVVFFMKSPFQTRDMIIVHRRAPQWQSVVFNLDHDYPLRSIEVVSVGDDGTADAIVWSLKREDSPVMSTFAYGQTLGGMRTVTPAEPLVDGATYRLVVKAPGARGEIEFVASLADAADHRRRGG